MNLLEVYTMASERAESYRNILQELVKRLEAVEATKDEELADIIGVAAEMLSEDLVGIKVIDMPKGSYSVRATEECNPDCLNIGTAHEECVGVRGEWLPKLLPGHTSEVICTIHEREYE